MKFLSHPTEARLGGRHWLPAVCRKKRVCPKMMFRKQSWIVRLLLLAVISLPFPTGPFPTGPVPAGLHADETIQIVRGELDEENQVQLLVKRTIQRLALGDAFDAKLRQRTWVQRHEVVGIGHYEQSGGGTGRYSLEMTIHDGDLRHTNQQISDGKLAWIRTQIGTTVTLRRVDLGRIEEFYRELSRQGVLQPSSGRNAKAMVDISRQVPPWLRVGGLVETVEQIAADYDLRLTKGFVDQQAAWILRGVIKAEAKARMSDPANNGVWSELSPYEVRMAIAAVGNERGFGVGLPNRIEFWGQPPRDVQPAVDASTQFADPLLSPKNTQADATVNTVSQTFPASSPADFHSPTSPIMDVATPSDKPRGDLISLLEVYSVRRIDPSPEERFRFEREDRDVNFFNDTRHYLKRIAAQHAGPERP